MNELAVRKADLPSLPIEDVKQCVDMIGDAIDGLKAKRNAAIHMNCDQEIIDKMGKQIAEYSAMKVQAQMELGKRTAEFEKNTDFHGNRFSDFQGAENTTITKSEQLSQLGIPKQRANEYEKMAKNEEVVNQYIEESLDNGKIPTKNGALTEIKKQESYVEMSDDGSVVPKKRNRMSKEMINFSKNMMNAVAEMETIKEFTLDDAIGDLNSAEDVFLTQVRFVLRNKADIIRADERGYEPVIGFIESAIHDLEILKGEITNG